MLCVWMNGLIFGCKGEGSTVVIMMILVRKIEDHRETNTKTRSRALLVKSKPVTEMKIEKIFTRVQLLQKLLDRFLACHPTCNAKNNRVVIVARTL
ncbi:hypothetical protein F2Q70_00016726 [Brassica cretica]|uniref:AP180 N-terminal homology (ANTH) domain-containing protein n=1 Tax=Brassica cretica TaxID=69181 RepID=A0A8S9HYM6_BRACR|nr:hypothetical protein F2Q70_00016726 [Brassica cretica]KAF2598493.1 hypothetical protein F2Q68_00009711 [Brassica cretica]